MSIDIIFLAILFIFIILRLRSILGTRSDDDLILSIQKTINEQEKEIGIVDEIMNNTLEKKFNLDEEAKSGINDIKAIEPSFDLNEFTNGAVHAFQLIITAYSQGDKETIKSLLMPNLYKAFEKNIDYQISKNGIMETTIVSVEIEKIDHIILQNKIASIKVIFKSEQVNVIKNSEGKIISGDPSHVDEIHDSWTFSKDLASSDPTWYLAKTS